MQINSLLIIAADLNKNTGQMVPEEKEIYKSIYKFIL